jgi:hypothetical protein
VLQPRQRWKLAWGTEDKEHAMSGLNSGIAAIGIDIGKNSFHLADSKHRRKIWERIETWFLAVRLLSSYLTVPT